MIHKKHMNNKKEFNIGDICYIIAENIMNIDIAVIRSKVVEKTTTESETDKSITYTTRPMNSNLSFLWEDEEPYWTEEEAFNDALAEKIEMEELNLRDAKREYNNIQKIKEYEQSLEALKKARYSDKEKIIPCL